MKRLLMILPLALAACAPGANIKLDGTITPEEAQRYCTSAMIAEEIMATEGLTVAELPLELRIPYAFFKAGNCPTEVTP